MLLNNKNLDDHLEFHPQNIHPYFSSASFWMPDLINGSAWLQHAPFAFWLIDACRPNMLVELGTHSGYSYFAFCQAIQRLELPTRCFAIDTWKGDEHSGFYGEEVFQDVNVYNQRYSSFSQLLRSSFDESLKYFLDGSIDILHIDGRHFYEDVKHDFETWLPKLSDRAVVLFHDTNVKERDFGVFKLWEELRQLYPHFEFIHGNGLGILGVGKSTSPKLRAFFDSTTDDENVVMIRSIYNRLGSTLLDRYQSNYHLDLTSNLYKEQARLYNDFINPLSDKLKIAEEEKYKMHLDIQNKNSEIQQLKDEKYKMNIDIEKKIREIQQLEGQVCKFEVELLAKDASIANFNQVITEICTSKSWGLALRLNKLRKFFSLS